MKTSIIHRHWLQDPTWIPLLAVTLLTLGSGYYTTLTSVLLSQRGESSTWIGVISAAYYTGLLLGALQAPYWIRRQGLGMAYAFFTVCTIGAVLLQGISFQPILWIGYRVLGGYALSALFVVIETWIVTLNSEERRGRALGLYLFLYYLASSLSQLFLHASVKEDLTYFVWIALLSGVSLIPISLSSISAPTFSPKPTGTLRDLWKKSAFGLTSSALAGALLSILYSLYPVYLLGIHATPAQVGELLLVVILAGAGAQMPIGKLADRGASKLLLFILLIISAGTSLGLLITAPTFLIPGSVILGITLFAIYPLSIHCVSKRLTQEEMLPAMALLSVSYSVGAIAGPLLMGVLLDLLGPSAFFGGIGITCVGFIFWGLLVRRL